MCVLQLTLMVALAVAVAVLAARCIETPTAVMACPDAWVGYRGACYYLSSAEGSWEWSKEQCFSLGASLAVLKREWEMEFLSRLKGKGDYWLGLRRRGERLEWVDGSSSNFTISGSTHRPCGYLSDHGVASSSCSQQLPYLCSKPQALIFQG